MDGPGTLILCNDKLTLHGQELADETLVYVQVLHRTVHVEVPAFVRGLCLVVPLPQDPKKWNAARVTIRGVGVVASLRPTLKAGAA